MPKYKNILLVDYENRHHLDLSSLDSSYRVIIFVGVHQNSEKLQKRINRKNKKSQVEYINVMGAGKNGLDFHIAFQLGRLAETSPGINTYILSADKGFDPLISHLDMIERPCKRVESISELPTPIIKYGVVADNPDDTRCIRCRKAETIEHNGGRWCPNCGRFAAPPDPEVTSKFELRNYHGDNHLGSGLRCSDCNANIGSGDGIFDDGEWVCFGCLGV